MSFPFLLRRPFSTSTRCAYRAKNIPEDIIANALTKYPVRRGRPKKADIEDINPEVEPQSASTSKVVRRPNARKGHIQLPVNRVDLPPRTEWRHYFLTAGMTLKSRISISNPETAALVADSFVPKGSRDKVIIEAYPGPGALTRALMQLPKERIRKIIVLEDTEQYLHFLKPLQEADPRVQVLPMNGFLWDTYHQLDVQGFLKDVETTPWNQSNPYLHFISHLPMDVLGEQLLAQLLRCAPEQSWLFKHGRIPMSYVMHDWVWDRISASTEDRARCKLSVIAQAVSEFNLTIDPQLLQPYDDHFFPHAVNPAYSSRTENRRRGTPFVAGTFRPLEHQIIQPGMLDKWDYCLRKLFVLKCTPLKNAVGHLAPGSDILKSYLTSDDVPLEQRTDMKKIIKKLNVEDWAAVVSAFDRWPFAPEELLITDSFSRDERI
ncbi:S-adenosyl-L-methionine-dependent methyltransferase [Suillus clintonianus]|uniref:S-adenosyl-L-methionine-dependent methyltransferase n=1 Tax=Suillus clintonianus TaxID=1904413 RepID=UPI001B87CB1D|nr:S-adenosyl-L-methionine-dependent methyltransferase [Suillus clintonianus]KAG2150847.1 S-adenosyl-L-methionine-dependent methyltransferase [Suillus clintonianus]